MTQGASALDQLMERTRALPTVVGSLRVETHTWSDIELSALASERARKVLVRRRPQPIDTPARRHEMRTRSWLEFGGDDDWSAQVVGVWPTRWREEWEPVPVHADVPRTVSGRDHDAIWWDHGDDVKVSDATRLMPSLVCAWVVGRAWTGARVQREVLGPGGSIVGRTTLAVRVTPTAGQMWGVGPFSQGDAHELLIDEATGLTLQVDSFIDGAQYQYHVVTDLEINAAVPPELTETPAGAERVPPSSPVRGVEEVAASAELAVLAPQWLPPGYTFQTGSARRRPDDTPYVSLIFSLERHEFVQLRESPETFPMQGDRTEWERVERGGRVVYISDQTEAKGQRIAHTTLAGTLAYARADLSAPDLLELMFSLAVVRADEGQALLS